MRGPRGLAGATAVAATLLGSCLAQDAVPYTDKESGITFATWSPTTAPEGEQGAKYTFGMVLPPDAMTKDANEYIGYLKCSSTAGAQKGWCGYSHGTSGQMIGSLLLVAWPHEGQVYTGFRYATDYQAPGPFQGNAKLTQIRSTVNDDGFELLYRCENCFSWDGETVKTSQGYIVGGRAQSRIDPENAGCPADAVIPFHNDGQNQWGAPLDTVVNKNYAEWAKLATKTVAGSCPNQAPAPAPAPPAAQPARPSPPETLQPRPSRSSTQVAEPRPSQERPARPADPSVSITLRPSVPASPTFRPTSPAPERPAPERPVPERPAPERPAPERPAPERPVPERPAPERPAPEREPTRPGRPSRRPGRPGRRPGRPSRPDYPDYPDWDDDDRDWDDDDYDWDDGDYDWDDDEWDYPTRPSRPSRPTRPRPERPAPERPSRPERPERPAPERPSRPERPAPERPAPERPAPERPAPERPAPERPAPERPTRPAPERPAPERPAPETPARPERPAPERPAPERPARPERPGADGSARPVVAAPSSAARAVPPSPAQSSSAAPPAASSTTNPPASTSPVAPACAGTDQTFDYIVVGAGAGGIPVADRLSEAGHSVLLVEKGARSTSRWGGWKKPEWLKGQDLTRFDVPGLCNQIWHDAEGIACTDMDQMAGCVLGGGTAVNAGLWWKPHPLDWDVNFPAGWKAADVAAATERVFKRIPGTSVPSMDGKLYQQEGFDVLAAGLTKSGWKYLDKANDHNTEKNRTFAHTNFMFSNAERGGPMATYLVSAAARKGFALWTDTNVRRLVREGGHITGVELESTAEGGHCGTVKVTAKTGRVVLSAGSFGSAKLLMRSGIGPQDQLDVVKASEEDGRSMIANTDWIKLPVGYNLVDHVNTDVVVEHPNVVQYNYTAAWWDPIAEDTQAYLRSRSGILASSAPNIGPMMWDQISTSDGQVRQLQWTSRMEGSLDFFDNHTITMSQYLGRGSSSRGRMTITPQLTTMVTTVPYLHDKADVEAVIQGLENMRQALKGVEGLKWLSPADNVTSADYVNNYVISSGARRSNHWIGTAKLGSDDGRSANGTAVVDLNTKVYGTDNLFVVDASIFPGHVTGNPSAMIVIAAEHAADKILALK